MKHTPCTQCGTLFPATGNWRRCETCRVLPQHRHGNAHRTGQNAVTRRPGTFIAVDGESFTDPAGFTHYTMLSVGDQTLTTADGRALDYRQIFEFLWEQFEHDRTATYIGFGLNFDFTHWVRSIPEYKGWRLLTKAGIATRRRSYGHRRDPFMVELDGGWRIDQLSRVKFKLEREGHKGTMTICDFAPYFQGSFMSVIDPSKWVEPVCTEEEYRILAEGKAARGDIQTAAEWVADYDTIARYNVTENRILTVVADRMKIGLGSVGIHLDRDQWYGPGQAAQEWLRVIGQPSGQAIRAITPPEAMDAAQASYYGGWFEVMAQGHLAGDTWDFDINSAYPAAMTHLPCQIHGTWEHQTRAALTLPFALCHVKLAGSNPFIGAAPYRSPTGIILRPHRVQGWYWAHELKGARDAGLIDEIEWLDAWVWTPSACPGSHEWIDPRRGRQVFNCSALPERMRALYELRCSVDKNSAQGKALKIVINSVYGKLAQSIGSPKYSNAFAASFITSWCRTRILEAIATHPEGASAVAMVATDGISFRSPHPGLDVTKDKLGAWELNVKKNMTIFMPGIYWDDDARVPGASPKIKSRGVSVRDIAPAIPDLDREFSETPFTRGWFPAYTVTKHFNHINARAAANRGAWHLAGQIEWADQATLTKETRIMSSTPANKRDVGVWGPDHRGDYRSGVWGQAQWGLESTGYSEVFGRMMEEDPAYRDMVDYDGPDVEDL